MNRPEIKKVYVVYKNTVYQNYILTKKNKNLCKFVKNNNPLVKHIFLSHQQNLKTIETVETTLSKLGVKYKLSQRTHIKSLKGYDLVITIGGDGTFFRTCHHVQNQLVLGVNSAPKYSVGALCSLNVNNFSENIVQILDKGLYKIKKMPRIQIKLNNKKLPIEPINDILYTNISPAATSRYLIEFHKIKEEHKSSGIWISTPSGSTAAISAAGGMKQHPNGSRLQYLTREPYQGIFNPYRLTRGFLKKEEPLKITSKMIKSRLFLDGPSKFFTLEYGDKLCMSHSKNHLNLVVL